jgi:hypothetical protein
MLLRRLISMRPRGQLRNRARDAERRQSSDVHREVDQGLMLPVSVATKRSEDDYLSVLQRYSKPTRKRRSARWIDEGRTADPATTGCCVAISVISSEIESARIGDLTTPASNVGPGSGKNPAQRINLDRRKKIANCIGKGHRVERGEGTGRQEAETHCLPGKGSIQNY